MGKKKKQLEAIQYENHWFVKSLKYTTPTLPKRKKKVKSLKWQRMLFDP